MSVTDWSLTADTNQTADTAINWREGQAPSTVNNSARAMMAAIAAMLQDQGAGSTVTALTTSQWAFVASQPIVTPKAYLFAFVAPNDSPGPVTMRFGASGTTDYPLRRKTGLGLVAGQIKAGSAYLASLVGGEVLLFNDATDFQSTVPASGGTFTGDVRIARAGANAANLVFGTGSSVLTFDGSNYTLSANGGATFNTFFYYGGSAHGVWHSGNFNPAAYAALGANVSFNGITGTSLSIAGPSTLASLNAAVITLSGTGGYYTIQFGSSRSLYYNPSSDQFVFSAGTGLLLPNGGVAWGSNDFPMPVTSVRRIAGGTATTTSGYATSVPTGAFVNGTTQATTGLLIYMSYEYIQYYRPGFGWVTIS